MMVVVERWSYICAWAWPWVESCDHC